MQKNTKVKIGVGLVLLAVIVGLLLLLIPRPTPVPTPAPTVKVIPKPTPAPEPEPEVISPPSKPTARKSSSAPSSKAQKAPALPEPPPPLFAYEGQTILGFSVPPRLYALVERQSQWFRIKPQSEECKAGAFNWPCYVNAKYGEEVVRIHVFRCVDASDRSHPKFDQQGCKNQQAYNESFPKN